VSKYVRKNGNVEIIYATSLAVLTATLQSLPIIPAILTVHVCSTVENMNAENLVILVSAKNAQSFTVSPNHVHVGELS